ncbi:MULTISPECIES: type VI immunity family protein [Corallococcus]|uniref:type VI immunity family protein n=1 Tax=Corallococcus TaxID=83461 RepID=UPI001F20A0AA|nr:MULTISPECIES: type VI immunity family protein [Corallococcus]
MRDGQGRVVVQVGLLATLYFENAHRPETRDAVLTCVERLQACFGQHLRWVVHPKSGKMYPHGSSRVPSLRAVMAQRGGNQAWEYSTHGGEQPEAASHFRIEAFGPPDWEKALGHLSFMLPLTWFADHPGSLPALMLELCNHLHPIHGYGGPGLAESPDVGVESDFQPAVYAMARRFPGLEVDSPLSHARYLGDGIKGVNWLTIVGERFLPRVGGIPGLVATLGDEISLREYDGGVLIQAGSRPRMGDANDGRIPEPYLRVAQALRPLRVESVGSLHFAGGNRFTPETSDEWLRRFDGP